jgi:F-type H+-transporting ATPase subunit b
LLWQLLAFLILLFVFWRWVLPPLLKFLDERRQRAIEIVEGSDRIKRELAEAEERTRQAIAEASRRAQDIIAQANATSERIVSDAAAKAQAAGAVELEKARSQIAAERDAAITELRREFADLAILAATKVVRQELSVNPDLQRRLISDVLDNKN